MQNLKDRVAWALSIIKSDTAFNKGFARDIDLAKNLGGIALNTLTAYKKGKGVSEIKAVVVEALANVYTFSPTWLLTGIGEPFPGARTKYPEACGPEPYKHETLRHTSVAESTSQYHPPPEHTEDSATIAHDMALTARILSSGTHYATALHLNIRSFAAGLEDLDKTEAMAAVQEKLIDLEKKMADIQQENKELRRQLTDLKADRSGGDCSDGVTDTSKRVG